MTFGVPACAVPAHEPAEIASRDVGEAADEVLDRRRLAVIAAEIHVHAGAEGVRADQTLEHPDDLGALLVHRRGIEIADLVVDLRPHVVRQRPRVLGKLRRAERSHLGDALHRRRTHVGGEFLVAEDRQALLETELEPVAAGHAIAGPVVKILVRDHPFDVGVVVVGRGLLRGEDIFVVENVEALVLHRPHIEIGHSDDVEDVEIILASIDLLVPRHGALERVHRIMGALLAAGLDIDGKRHIPSGGGDEGIGNMAKIACDQREQIARLPVRIGPDRPVAARNVGFACAFEVSIGEQNRRLGAIRFETHAIGRKHVRTIEKIGNAAKALRLALGAVG